MGVDKDTAALYFHHLRELIAYHLEQEVQGASATFGGEIEVDESYFGGCWKGKQGRGAGGKIPAFGILQRGDHVYTQIIPNAKSNTLIPIIEDKVVPDSIVYSDCWQVYNALDVSGSTHLRINYSKQFDNKRNHINGVDVLPHFAWCI